MRDASFSFWSRIPPESTIEAFAAASYTHLPLPEMSADHVSSDGAATENFKGSHHSAGEHEAPPR